ncbi:Heme exporter protein C [Photobacterium damselae subsp. piscicida]|uniref:Heme exporter protein C n=1 Tax=Photobacterium damsela subsp. piscicida TaxID=38294 RepID=A0A1V1VA87_PHODP|nr:heme ABC transporter permease [Photobacterium damselae]MBE8129780.1 heme ABC transporter permease [Photobacterium damselae subsp. piscicida]MDP2559261.1 heme ABC transporter permease [Photobacterium damselae subsp. piscicida]PSV73186.1 heme ABC transporter permease [Photobacterium damselae]PSW77571.1 heme ABC transporter permease [Photobacterium damselae]QOD51976.1 heme ABC transporter permease [Photobacterium damselae subsp. piscicida]
MWKWLHPYAKPERCYQLCGTLLPWFSVLAFSLILVGTIWGLMFAPTDYQQGDSFRLIYWHVPAAIWSMGAYVSMAIAAFIGLVWQIRLSDMAAAAMAPVGAVFTFIALFTGAVWGKPMWGTWWVWDARLTSELILLFLYLGIIALYNAFDDHKTAAKAAGLLAIVGVINIPIIHFSVEWWNTLHQGATITKFAKPSMSTDMLWPLLLNIFGYAFFFGVVTMISLRNEILLRESHRPWVRELVK